VNSIHFIAALGLTLSAITGMAADQRESQGSGQALTRASVIQDLSRARQDRAIGTYGDSDRTFNEQPTGNRLEPASRVQVLVELQHARDSGELLVHSDLYGANLMVGRPESPSRSREASRLARTSAPAIDIK
jgi:hypothetical protein